MSSSIDAWTEMWWKCIFARRFAWRAHKQVLVIYQSISHLSVLESKEAGCRLDSWVWCKGCVKTCKAQDRQNEIIMTGRFFFFFIVNLLVILDLIIALFLVGHSPSIAHQTTINSLECHWSQKREKDREKRWREKRQSQRFSFSTVIHCKQPGYISIIKI